MSGPPRTGTAKAAAEAGTAGPTAGTTAGAAPPSPAGPAVARRAVLRGLGDDRWAPLRVVAVGVAAGLVGQFLLGDYVFDATTAVIYVLFAMGTNVLFGWTGLPSFGQAAFFGIGGYTVALLGQHDHSGLGPLAVGLVAGLLAAAVVGAAVIRSGGLAFSMFTLAVAQVVYQIAENTGSLGRDSGLSPVLHGDFPLWDVSTDLGFWWLAVAICTVAIALLRRLRSSSFGATAGAVRQDPARAAALGIPIRRVRVIAFVVAGGLGALAGGLFAQLNGIVTPQDDLFWTLSGNVLLMIMLGDIRSFWGPAIGAVGFTALNKIVLQHTVAPDFYTGLILLVVVVLMPNGLGGGARWLWSRFRTWIRPTRPA
jgi:branched-chain amino acid transport system permease protein